MATVKQLKKILANMPDDYEVVIYPKYSSEKVNGFNKHSFKKENVCEQEPYAVSIKNNKEKLKEYFGGKKPKKYEINNHIAIIF